jgi:hypothetical protein
VINNIEKRTKGGITRSCIHNNIKEEQNTKTRENLRASSRSTIAYNILHN